PVSPSPPFPYTTLFRSVGVIAGIGAVIFYVASIAVFHYTLGDIAGYHPYRPLGEHELFAASDRPLNLWLLLVVPTIGGLVSGVLDRKSTRLNSSHQIIS